MNSRKKSEFDAFMSQSWKTPWILCNLFNQTQPSIEKHGNLLQALEAFEESSVQWPFLS